MPLEDPVFMVSHPLGAVPPVTPPGVAALVAATVKGSGAPELDVKVSDRVGADAPVR
jgi:hypothetical protein